MPSSKAPTRRDFLTCATGAMSAVAVVAIGWPLVDQMSPDARVRAAADLIDVSLDELAPGRRKQVRWRGLPFLVTRRTADMLAALQEPRFTGRLVDAHSQRRREPDYARNWHRSIRPEHGVMAAACAHCACILRAAETALPQEPPGAFLCPCCASRYDAAGRAYAGPAQFNLAIPPHAFSGRATIVLGKNPPGEYFTFASINGLPQR